MPPRALLSVAVLLAFGASITHGFHFDDYSVIHGPVWQAWQTRPLTWLSFAMNAAISIHPALWHAVSLAAHLAAVLLLYQLLLRFMSPTAALLGAAVFAVHPIQAESVAYVYSRATLFSTALCIAAGLLWLRGRLWFAVGCFAMAMLAKEDCASVPLVILLLDRRNIRSRIGPIAVMFAIAIATAFRTLAVTRAITGSGAGFTAGISPQAYMLNQGYVIVRYLRLIFAPYGFSIDPEIHVSMTLALISWVAVAALAIFAARRQRWILAGLILLIPSSSVFPLADLAADHRMYLPMAAFAGCAGVWLAKLPRALGVAIVLLLIGISAQRMTVWAGDEKLWSEAVEQAPGKLRPHIQLSRALPPTRALTELNETQARYPDNPAVEAELGRVYLELGHPELALAEFGKVLAQEPGDAHAINNRGVALRALGQEDAARQDFERALKIDGCLADARQNLGLSRCR